MKVYIKKIEGVVLPQRGSDLSAGYDIVATSDPKIVGGGDFASSHKRIDYIEYETNLFIAPSMVTTHTLIHPRSSISKYNLVLANSIGLVDNDYRGMVICRFKYIWQPEDFTIIDKDNTHLITLFGYINRDKIYKKGDKIAQLVFEPTIQVEFEIVDDLTQTQRGEGGFGSTDQPKGKTLMEVFSEENKTTPKTPNEIPSILDKYLEAGGVQTPIPYSEQIKKRGEV
jgi:dUTP pyrophosphatase